METGVTVPTARPAAVLVLAAGEGKRMKSATPKVLHTLCGRSMLGHVVAAARGLEPEHLVVVVGHGREQVVEHLAAIDPAIRPVVQEVQHGTGHAVQVAMDALAQDVGELDGTVVVAYGDTPLLTTETLAELTAAHQETGNAVTVLSAVIDDPTGYGRIVRRRADGRGDAADAGGAAGAMSAVEAAGGVSGAVGASAVEGASSASDVTGAGGVGATGNVGGIGAGGTAFDGASGGGAGSGVGMTAAGLEGEVALIVEQKDATPEQRAIREVNSGVYAFDAKLLVSALGRLTPANAQGEFYLTDALGILVGDGHAAGVVVVEDESEILGANDRVQLAELRRIFNARLTRHWMLEGVTIVDPATTWLDVDVTFGRDSVVRPNTQLLGSTSVAEGAEVGPNCTLSGTEVGPGAKVTNATTEGAVIGAGATVGPYTYLRAGTRLGPGAKAGGFVEMKNAVVGDGAKVPHLSYVGDASIGAGSNIGAGTITANYDGVSKHRTEIGEHAFVGSNSVLIAPAVVEDGAYVAAGSAITEPVAAGHIAVARGRQRNIRGWVARMRPGTKSAAAAEAAARKAAAEAEAD
jgi:bifunctional UDP-N-acetylglucosamine pyrophosphorylase / glucosamine-1-phosphate N-acetyltransferase